MLRQLGPQKPTASFQFGRKERTQRSPACGPFAPLSGPRDDLRLARGLPSRPSTAPRISASLETTPRHKGQMALPLTRPSYGGIKSQPLLHSAQDRRRQAANPHSGCDRGPIRQLRSLLRHPGCCGNTVGPATRDGTCSALLPLLFCLPRPSGPTSCLGRGPAMSRAPPERGAQHTMTESRTSLVHTPALRPGGFGTAACPATAGARICARP